MAASAAMSDEPSARLADRARAFGIPGAAVALVAPGRHAVFTVGEDAPGSGRAVTEDTWFSVASLGKHVTACAVLELAQSGRIALEAPIGDYLKDLPEAWCDRSVLSLMRHTSGLPEYLSHSAADAVPERRNAFMRAYGALSPAFDSGQGWIYTNTNYILLGFLIAQQAGCSYADAVQALFDRAKCPGATVASPQWTRDANVLGLGSQARDEASARREVIGDGDVSFTARGALRWLQVLLGGGLLQRRSLDTMFSSAPLHTGRPAPYGCGWFVDRLRSDPIGYHGGHFDGWTAMAYLAPALGCGAMVMCNLAPGNTRAVRYLAQQALEDFAPGSTPLSLAPMRDDDPGLTATARTQLLRQGDTLDVEGLAEELRHVVAHGSTVRNVINLWAGVEPRAFELVEQHASPTHRLRRYRITYPERSEHLLVGTTPERKIFWAWPL